MIYAIRTTSGREDIVIDLLSTKLKNKEVTIKAIVHPAEIKGYIFAEGKLGEIQKTVQGMMHIRGIIETPIKLDEIQHFLERKKAVIKIEEGNVVEIIGGPFKGEKGKITRIDKVKDEVTIELLDAAIPIPVTIAAELVKILKRTSNVNEDDEEKPAQDNTESE
jgi:transcriptional antiterminator NusG